MTGTRLAALEAVARDKATRDAYRSAASFAHQMGNAGKDAFAVAREMDRRAAALTEEIAAVRANAVKVDHIPEVSKMVIAEPPHE